MDGSRMRCDLEVGIIFPTTDNDCTWPRVDKQRITDGHRRARHFSEPLSWPDRKFLPLAGVRPHRNVILPEVMVQFAETTMERAHPNIPVINLSDGSRTRTVSAM